MKRLSCLIFGLVLLAPMAAFAESDADSCKDHPLFTRMKNYYIVQCEKKYDQGIIMIDEDPDSPKNHLTAASIGSDNPPEKIWRTSLPR